MDTRNFECLIASSCLFLSVSMNLIIFVLIWLEEGLQKKGFSSNTFICGERKNYDKYTESLAFFSIQTQHQTQGAPTSCMRPINRSIKL